MSVETAGSRGTRGGETTGQPWIAPILPAAAAGDLVRQIIPEARLDSLAWQPVHPGAFRRVLVRATLLVWSLSLLAFPWAGWWTAALLAGGAAAAAVAAKRHVTHMAWAATGEVVAFRSGWLWKKLTMARTTKVQTVAMVESPFDRRTSMAAVRVDTAGAGAQSHRVRIPYLDRGVAAGLHADLARRAAASSFRW